MPCHLRILSGSIIVNLPYDVSLDVLVGLYRSRHQRDVGFSLSSAESRGQRKDGEDSVQVVGKRDRQMATKIEEPTEFRKICDGGRSRWHGDCRYSDAAMTSSRAGAGLNGLALAVGLHLRVGKVVPTKCWNAMGGDPDGQQLCVSLRGDVVQIRTSRGTQRTTQGRRFWGSRCESTGLRDVCDGCPSLERVGRTRIPLSARRLGERVIEFYRPTSSRKPLRGAPQVQSGKLRVLFADEEISLASQQPVQRSISLYALKGLHLLLLVPGYGT